MNKLRTKATDMASEVTLIMEESLQIKSDLYNIRSGTSSLQVRISIILCSGKRLFYKGVDVY